MKKGMQLQAEEETTLDLLREDFETVENEALLCRFIHINHGPAIRTAA